MQLVVLSGGKGVRLYPITLNLPKTMVKINGKPILEYHIEHAKKFGIKEIVMCIGHLPEKIIEHFGDGSKFGVNIKYSIEKESLGTGGPLALAKDLIKEDFFLLNGDIMCTMDMIKLEAFHRKNEALVSVVIHKSNHPEDSDLIEIDNETRIKKIWTKPHKIKPLPTNLTNAGAYFCSKEILNHIPLEQISFERVILPQLVKDNKKIYGYYTNEFLRDVGTHERLKEIEDLIRNNNGRLPEYLY